MKIIRFQESYGAKRNKRVSISYLKMWVVILVIIFLASSVIFFLFKKSWIATLCIALIFFFYVWLNKDRKAIKAIIRATGVGVEGEEKVLMSLQKDLGDEYTYIQNYQAPNTYKGDIDGILFGPKGLIILEVKTWHGRFKVACGEIYKKIGYDVFKLYKNPFAQIKKQVDILGGLLHSRPLSIRIKPLIVLVGGNIFQIKDKTGTYIIEDHKLLKFIEGLPNVASSVKRDDLFKALGVKEAGAMTIET